MSDQETQSGPPSAGQAPPWSQIWHVPTLLLGLGLFVMGMWLIWPSHEPYPVEQRLNDAEQYLLAQNLDAAQDVLGAVGQHVEEATEQQIARLHQYLGDLTFLQVREQYEGRAVDTQPWRENHRRVLERYEQAEEMGRELDGRSLRRYAQTLVALGRQEEAVALVERLTAEGAEPRQRYLVLRSLIERHLEHQPALEVAAVMPLFEQFHAQVRQEPDAERRREQELWLSDTQARLHIELDQPQRAIEVLLRRIQRLGDEGDLAPLWARLGEAFKHDGELEEARHYYELAREQLDSTDPLNAPILLGLGRIALQRVASPDGEVHDDAMERALDHFARVTHEFPSERVYIEALIARADTEARMGDHDQALDHFQLAVAELLETTEASDPRRAMLTETVREHAGRLADVERFERALDLLAAVQRLHEPDLPAELLRELAQLHERYARQLRERVEPGDEPDRRRALNQEAAVHFARAGEFALAHAREVTIADDEAHGQSLWDAARNFDRAQRWQQAIRVYDEFIQTREHDPRVLGARSLVGQAHLADGAYDIAVDRLQRLVDEHPRSPEAYASLVPLAQGLMAMDANDDAERVLRNVVNDHEAIGPASEEYREALTELAKLYYRMGESDPEQYVDAIERFEEAVERYGETDQRPQLHFLLADAYRKSVTALEEEIERRQSQRERARLRDERDRRLEQAQANYDRVVTELEQRSEQQRLSELEQLYLRNAYFYRADAAYDREDYELAIELYHDAALRWREDPSSLMALVQIFNAHCELGQFQQARVANQRARAQLERIPDEAFDDPNLPMSRQHWQDWLRWTSEVELREPRAEG